MQYVQKPRSLFAAPLVLVVLLTSWSCSPPAGNRCAGIDCGDHGSCVVVGGAPRCECAVDYVQVGSQCVVIPDGGVEGCGNGVADDGETCDGQDLRGETCIGLGFSGGGALSCRDTCDHYDTSGCVTYCGDGLAGGTEVCDGSQLNFETCEGLGFYAGQLSCDASCLYDTADCLGRCGDGIVDFGPEDCDGTNLALHTCVTEGFYLGTLACDASCNFDTSGCLLECGDGIFQSGYESCEGSELGGETCESLNFNSGTLGCTTECEFDTSQCVSDCGNGVINAGEVCDDGNNVDGDGCSADCSAGRGNIVFVSDRSNGFNLYTMTDDGTNLTPLTTDINGGGLCDGTHNPRWSPDGRLVAFRLGGLSGGCADPEIWVVSVVSGAATTVLQTNVVGGLSWSRDGTQIIYSSGDPMTIRSVNVDGSGDTLLFDGINQEQDPDYHPFLDRIVYSQFAGGGDYPGLFAVDTSGQNPLQLVGECLSGCALQSARWSSNGARVLFHRNGAIVWVAADGSADGTVLSGTAGLHMDWLTDSFVVYQTEGPDENLVVRDLNGANPLDLTFEGGFDGEPDWHPGQRDSDIDGYLDWEDNCVTDWNPGQADGDQDGVGDACP